MTADVIPATSGAGPLLQRDYWAVFSDCGLSPSELMAHVKAHFCSFPPAALVSFAAPEGLALNAGLDIVITPAQRCGVRVVHCDPQSVTLATLAGHPEAGRITFGAYRNREGELIFHIRSRARSGSVLNRVGFLVIGEAMQTNTWADFIRNAAASVDARIAFIHAQTEENPETAEDDEPLQSPTFMAVGD